MNTGTQSATVTAMAVPRASGEMAVGAVAAQPAAPIQRACSSTVVTVHLRAPWRAATAAEPDARSARPPRHHLAHRLVGLRAEAAGARDRS